MTETANKILVTATNYSSICKEGKSMLEAAGFQVIENPYGRPMKFEELREIVPEICGVVAGVDCWDEKVFSLAPKLKVIARLGVGVDNIDLEGAKKRGIAVTNCMGANSNAVSEEAAALILSSVRMIPRLMDSTKNGKWERAVFHEFCNMTIGFLGFGAIGRMTAEKLKPFRARMVAYDPYPNLEEADRLGVNMVDINTLLSQSDVISIHVPSTPETYHMINDKTIGKMKTGVHIINTARGAIVDEKALYQALKSGKIAGAAVDVYEEEPVNPANPLFRLDNFIGTPHTSAETYENYERCGKITAQAILDYFSGKSPANLLTK